MMNNKPYFGSKNGSGILQQIINIIPPHTTYIEPFLGSGIVIKKKKPADLNIGFELNRTVINEYHQHSQYTVHNLCGIQFINNLCGLNNPTTLIYCDPPYLLETRTGNHRYKYDMTDADHIDILKILLTLQAAVIISTYPNNIYSSMLSGWSIKSFQTMTRGGIRTEQLYFNYPVPEVLHQYDYLGKDFTDRQRIKRKISRWHRKLQLLTPTERNAILESLKHNQ